MKNASFLSFFFIAIIKKTIVLQIQLNFSRPYVFSCGSTLWAAAKQTILKAFDSCINITLDVDISAASSYFTYFILSLACKCIKKPIVFFFVDHY